MSDVVLSALITGSLAVVAQLLISRQQSKSLIDKLDKDSALADAKLEAKLEKSQAVTDTKIQQLTDEVRKHNAFAERIPVMEEKIKVANHRIDDLEHRKTA